MVNTVPCHGIYRPYHGGLLRLGYGFTMVVTDCRVFTQKGGRSAVGINGPALGAPGYKTFRNEPFEMQDGSESSEGE